jgi:hypothetical protein
MSNRNLSSTFYAPNSILVHNLDSGKKVDCAVIEYNDKRITCAIAGAKIILNMTNRGVYEGKMAGMVLVYDPAKK